MCVLNINRINFYVCIDSFCVTNDRISFENMEHSALNVDILLSCFVCPTFPV